MKKALIICFSLAVFGTAGFLAARLWDDGGLPIYIGLPAVIATALTAAALMVAVHEAGHLLMVRPAGWRTHLVGIGPFLIKPNPVTVRFGIMSIGGDVGGFVLALPEEGKTRRDVLFYAGGVGVSALTGLAAIPAALAVPEGSWLSAFLVAYAVLALGIGAFLNALPFESTAGPSDGKHILAALQGRDLGHSGAASRLLGLAFAGVRPRDWPTNLVEAVRTAPHEGLMAIQAHAILYGWHLDRGEIDQAKAALAEARHAYDEAGAPPMAASLLVEQAFVAAYIDGDGTAARALLAEVPKKAFAEPYAVARAEAAAALALKEHEAAREALTRLRAGLAAPMLFATEDEFEIADALERRAAALAGAPAESAP